MNFNEERANATSTLDLAGYAPTIPLTPSTRVLRDMNVDSKAGRSHSRTAASG